MLGAERTSYRAARRSNRPPARPAGRPRRAAGGALAAAVLAVGTTGCGNLFTVEDDMRMGQEAYAQVLAEQKILDSGPAHEQVQRVTERLVASTREIDPGIAERFEWEVTVIDDPGTVNAFCLPGGKMAVYTGILPVAESDAGLAVVMGHEIAHAIRRHGTERVSRNMQMDIAIGILAKNEDQAQIASLLGNLGVGLPWGRADESEADRVGLSYMANAGYDPREAVKFWQRMSALSGGGSSGGLGEFLSTHPSDERRIADIREELPRVMPLYRRSRR